MQFVPQRPLKFNLVLPTFGLAIVTALLWAVLLAGRSVPWQAGRIWLFTFAAAFFLAGAWWRHYLHRMKRFTTDPRAPWLPAIACATVPFLAIATGVVAGIYLSDSANDVVAREEWKVATIVFAVLLTLFTTSLQQASVLHLERDASRIWHATRLVLGRYSSVAGWGSIAFIGLLQAVAGVAPIGDDIWHFSFVADAILEGRPYPIPVVEPHLQQAGMGSTYPALPFMPTLIALSFKLFGRNLVGVSMPTVVATALFPVLMYATCRALTRNTLVAYAATLLLYLFPIYQIHILGSPEPDTIFVALLLIAALWSIRACEKSNLRYWIGLGLAMGLATLTRPEGIFYSVALFLVFLLFHYRRTGYWLAGGAWLVVVAPFSLFYRSLTGDLWPSTLGAKMLGLENLQANLAMLQWPALEWYCQAIGVSSEMLKAGLLAISVLSVVGALAILKEKPSLVWIPAAGAGNVLMGFVTNPMVMATYSPVEFLRHDAFGIPFVAISVAQAVAACSRVISRLPWRWGQFLSLAALLLFAAGLYYECGRMALPERYFGGSSSLLWTGSSYLLTDLWSKPVPMPAIDDAKSGEQVRADVFRPIEEFSLRRVNRSAPYHWATLLVALFGLVYLASSARGTVPQRSRPTDRRPLHTASGQQGFPS